MKALHVLSTINIYVKDMNIIPIAFAFDNNLSFPACICISSLLMNANPNTFYDIFILHSQKEELDKKYLKKIPQYYTNCKIHYRQVDNTFDLAFEIRGITTPAYYRLLIPELIQEYDKIIYSDVDVIFRNDLSNFYFETDLDDYYVAGVKSLSHLYCEKYYSKKLHLIPQNIIYSGNIIFNSKKIRECHLISQFKELAKNNYTFQDMDILNIACKDKIKYLSPEFCLTTYILESIIYHKNAVLNIWKQTDIDKALQCGVIHYNGQKPWKGYCVNFDIWWEYYRKSPFFDEKFYFDFFYNKLNEFDCLSLWKRIKILARYFIYGKK
ncbi:glycosyltransferase family 8 protein [Bacteroides sp. ET225]|uniref:glycosyltransferase family 8 protein n=1 Tax=Bacteroides sp. ET225 TaxID=2972461 RepID=UPI0021AC4F65|nr:glycosyltransferase family 8 protein [Bacteroides sp. ET225]MCR8916922.1 glycosyltransferase family 8 protein [Bacteroides sp. ET225]